MNNYYPYGYSPYPGQPPNQPYGFPTAPPFPAQTYPPPANNAFDAYPQPRDPYEASQNIIPGLGFGPPAQAFGWHQPMQTAPQVPQPPQAHQTSATAPAPFPRQHLPSREEPKLIPAFQYYQPADSSLKASMSRASAPQGGVRPSTAKQLAKGTEDAEEGELSEGEFDDVYEPAGTIMGTGSSHPVGNAASKATANQGRNAAAASVWHSGPSEHKRAASPEALDATGRERSGSYSPHLSPREMVPAIVDNRQSNTNGLSRQSAAPGIAATSHNAFADARKEALAAIRHLSPMGIRFQQFVDAGIDEKVLRNLFTELGLDISNPPLPAIPGTSVPQASGRPHSPAQAALKPSGTQTPAASNQPASAAKSAGEERKDRIARLLAAKNAKAAPAPTSADGPQVDPKIKSDKEVLQQQKMEALQKSRDARAHKAANRKDSLQAPSGGLLPSTTQPAKVAPAAEAPQTSLPQQPEPASASTSAIPGLFMSAAQPAARNQRKRPVAANFITDTQPTKRPFGHHRQERPFVIDVSDASDDEDVEMEIGSPTDESTGVQQATPSHNTASFREFPPLTDGRPQLSPGPSNVATPQSGIIAAQPKQGHLEVMDKQIEAMKRKIALAEAKRRLKASMNGQSSGLKSNGQTPEAATESDVGKPNMRRVQSMGASDATDQPKGDSSPVVAEASSSLRLPKLSDNNIQNASIRAEKRRAVSTSLPLVENRLQAKKSKLRLLQSQMTRLQKEIEEDDAEREKLAREMEQMEQDSDEAAEPQSQLKSNSVDPVVTEVPTRAHSEVQTSQLAAETTLPHSTPENETAASNSVNTAIPVPPSVAQSDIAPAIGAGDADNAAVGLVATDLAGIPDATDEAVAALPNVSAGLVASVDEVEDSRPATSSSDSPSDVVMGGSESSNSQDEERSQEAHEEPYQEEESESSEAYEPPEAFAPSGPANSPSISPVPAGSTVSLANSDADPQELNSRTSPIPEQISLGVNESTPEQGVDAAREAPEPTQNADEMATNIQYTPYESPLQYFRAYRYHPKFAETIAGGLRSLTFSNKIDPKLPICPDQLANRDCPRGADCIYQHFETMQLPDDQILLQLGGSQFDGPEKAQYNDGLRKLLQEMRSQNIRDFPSIAQGIVDYHNRFTGDPSKILPLGNISI